VLRAVLLSVVPGVAQVDRGRCLRGLGFFILFAALANVALIAPLLTADGRLRLGAALSAGGVWLLSLCDACRIAKRPSGASAAPLPPAPSKPAEGGP
jgi:hypothetical protein